MLKNKILDYLSNYTTITEELEKAISESTVFRTYKKGTFLLQEGEVSDECFFVLKGCVRSYFVKDGEEKTIAFYTEEQSILHSATGEPMPSKYALECTEDAIVSVGNPQIEKEAFQKYPQLASLSRIIAERVLNKEQESFIQFKTSTAEERYLHLVETRPDLVQRVSQYHIASYLGIQPESLSRIRKRIMNKK